MPHKNETKNENKYKLFSNKTPKNNTENSLKMQLKIFTIEFLEPLKLESERVIGSGLNIYPHPIDLKFETGSSFLK